MKTVIYLDLLLGVNLLIAWCMLRATGWLTGAPSHWLRILLASILASLSTLTILAPTMSPLMQICTKFGSAVCIVAVAFPHSGPVTFAKRALWYFLLNLLLAGSVLFLAIFWGTSHMETNNLSIYLNISPQLLVLSVLCVWLVLKIAEIVFTPPPTADSVELQISIDDQVIHLEALGDSGCRLHDPFTGQKVVLISLPGARAQLPVRLANAVQQYFEGQVSCLPGLRLLSCTTAGGKALLPAFSAQKLVLKQGSKTVTESIVTVGITKESFQPGYLPALVGADWLERFG